MQLLASYLLIFNSVTFSYQFIFFICDTIIIYVINKILYTEMTHSLEAIKHSFKKFLGLVINSYLVTINVTLVILGCSCLIIFLFGLDKFFANLRANLLGYKLYLVLIPPLVLGIRIYICYYLASYLYIINKSGIISSLKDSSLIVEQNLNLILLAILFKIVVFIAPIVGIIVAATIGIPLKKYNDIIYFLYLCYGVFFISFFHASFLSLIYQLETKKSTLIY